MISRGAGTGNTEDELLMAAAADMGIGVDKYLSLMEETYTTRPVPSFGNNY